MSTPIVMDAFSRLMADLFDERDVIGVSTGFQTFFGRPETTARTIFSPDANAVDIDIIRGNEKTAALIHRGQVGRLVNGTTNVPDTTEENYTSTSRKYPLGEEVSDMNADQILKRLAGEAAQNSGVTKFDRLRLLASRSVNEHIRRFVRMFERLAAQSVLDGIQDTILGTSDTGLQYDYRRSAGNTITVGTAWDQGGATIIPDVDGGCEQLRETAKVTPDMIIIGGSAMDSFINDTDVKSQADNRRFELIQVGTNNPVPAKFDKFVAAGFTARGRLRTPKGFELWIFTYLDGFTSSGGAFTNYMPGDKALIAHSGARCDRYYGPGEVLPVDSVSRQLYREYFGFDDFSVPMPARIKNMGSTVLPAMFMFDAYKSPDNKTVSIRTQTAPIFATTQTDAFVTLEGLTT